MEHSFINNTKKKVKGKQCYTVSLKWFGKFVNPLRIPNEVQSISCYVQMWTVHLKIKYDRLTGGEGGAQRVRWSWGVNNKVGSNITLDSAVNHLDLAPTELIIDYYHFFLLLLSLFWFFIHFTVFFGCCWIWNIIFFSNTIIHQSCFSFCCLLLLKILLHSSGQVGNWNWLPIADFSHASLFSSRLLYIIFFLFRFACLISFLLCLSFSISLRTSKVDLERVVYPSTANFEEECSEQVSYINFQMKQKKKTKKNKKNEKKRRKEGGKLGRKKVKEKKREKTQKIKNRK